MPSANYLGIEDFMNFIFTQFNSTFSSLSEVLKNYARVDKLLPIMAIYLRIPKSITNNSLNIVLIDSKICVLSITLVNIYNLNGI